MDLSNLFVNVEFYKNEKLIHTFNNIPRNRVPSILVRWNGEIKAGRVDEFRVVNGDTVKTTSLHSSHS